jgi:hypothetical protein
MGKIKDITGQRFGRLIALRPTEERQQRQVVWECQCDCGNICKIASASLLQGKTKSCGCLKKDTMKGNTFGKGRAPFDLTGKRFGKLVAIESVGKLNNDTRYSWRCKCDCGNECIVSVSKLTSGERTNCGCERQSKGEIKIKELLKINNIDFIEQYSLDKCRFNDTHNKAFFDFYVNNQYIIEFDGEQHFKISDTSKWKEKSIITQEHDKFKNQWCKDNNIPLIRIPYTHLDDLCVEDLQLETSEYRVV